MPRKPAKLDRALKYFGLCCSFTGKIAVGSAMFVGGFLVGVIVVDDNQEPQKITATVTGFEDNGQVIDTDKGSFFRYDPQGDPRWKEFNLVAGKTYKMTVQGITLNLDLPGKEADLKVRPRILGAFEVCL